MALAIDEHTGQVPNAEWCFGKLNILAALDRLPEECLGDLDANGVGNLVDLAAVQACVSGLDAGPVSPGCRCADFDNDNDLDLHDFGQFQLVFTALER